MIIYRYYNCSIQYLNILISTLGYSNTLVDVRDKFRPQLLSKTHNYSEYEQQKKSTLQIANLTTSTSMHIYFLFK